MRTPPRTVAAPWTRLLPLAALAGAVVCAAALIAAARAGEAAPRGTAGAVEAPPQGALALPPGFPFGGADLAGALRFDSAGAPTATPSPAPTATAPAAVPSPTVSPRPAAPAAPVATPTPVPAAPQPRGLDTSPMDGFEQALFDATNARRASVGLPPLRANGLLVGIARLRSDEMARYGYFSHDSPITGDTAFSLMDAYGVPYAWAGENLAKNNYPDGEAVGVADQALWDSQPHRENIVNPHYTDMGIALTVDASGMKYFTIIFTGP